MMRFLGLVLLIHFFGLLAGATCTELKVGSKAIRSTTDEFVIQEQDEQKLVPLKEESVGDCLSMGLARDSQNLVAVEFWGLQKGTSILVSNHLFGVIDLDKAEWAVEPFPLESKVDGKGAPKKRIISTIEWRKSPQGMTLWKKLSSSEPVQIWPETKKVTPVVGASKSKL